MSSRRYMGILLAATLAATILVTAAIAVGKSQSSHGPPAALDSSFGSQGIVTLGRGYQLLGVANQPDGKIAVVGDQRLPSSVRLVVARLTSAGRLDRSFNHGRVALGPLQKTGGSIGRAVAIQRDGKIVVAGVLTDRSGIAEDGMLVERFTSGGALDRRFGSGGVATALAGTSQSAGSGLAIQGNGKILVAGSGPGSDGLPRIALVRLSGAGRLDRGFGAGGVRIAEGSQDLGRDGSAAAVALQGGKVLVAGLVRPNLQVSNAVVARFSSRGDLDRSFASRGSFVVPGRVEGGAAALFQALSVGRGGAIAAAGAAASDGATPAFALAVRLSSNGTPVGSFGRRGIVVLPSDRSQTPPSVLPGANGVAFARGGVVVLAGSYQDSGRSEVALWSLNPRGSLLASGTTRTGLGKLGSGGANGLAIDPQGRIVVVGTSNNFVAFNGFGLRYRGFGP